MRYWKIIADKLSAPGLSWGPFIRRLCEDGFADAYRDGKRFTVIADYGLTAFPELEAACGLPANFLD
jgi:hypothetical protein